MLRRAVRRPARLDLAPRWTRATAPAYTNPSCTGVFFLDFNSFIDENPHKEKRDPNSRSTLHHSLGPRGTQIPLSTAVLASVTGCSAGRFALAVQLASTMGSISPRAAKARPGCDRSDRSKPSPNRQTKSLSHRTTRNSTFNYDIFWRFGPTMTSDSRLEHDR
jgi:hypothetical protein